GSLRWCRGALRRPAPLDPAPRSGRSAATRRCGVIPTGVRSPAQTPLLIAVYATLSFTLSGQWIAAKLGVAAVPPLELSTMRFAIASAVLLAACAITRTPLPVHRWRPVVAAAAFGVVGFNSLAFV